jgi:uncharacterized protein YndB with AHSA1/START domain
MADLKLELTQVFDAPINKVWEAWTDIEKLKQWSGPEGMEIPLFECDFRIGGTYKMVMEGNPTGSEGGDMRHTVGGKYIEIEEPKKLVYSWLWEGQNPETHTTTITLLFKELGEGKTEFTLIQTGFPDENMVNEHNQGWTSTLRKLTKFLTV